MASSEARASVMKLAPDDNVAVALRPLSAGESILLDGGTLAVDRDIAVGHKLAARAIAAGRDDPQVQLPDRRRHAATSAPARTCTRTT